MGDFPAPENWWIGLILFLLFGSPALFSKGATKLPSVLGAGARWWQSRSVSRSGAVSTMTKQQLQIFVDERVELATRALTDELAEQTEYLAYDAEYHRRSRITMAENGWELPPPPHKTLTEWRAERKTVRIYQGNYHEAMEQ